jgi:hypothetical protein
MGRFPLEGSLYGLRVNQLWFSQNLTLIIDSTGIGQGTQDPGDPRLWASDYIFSNVLLACLNVACRPPSADVFASKDGQS